MSGAALAIITAIVWGIGGTLDKVILQTLKSPTGALLAATWRSIIVSLVFLFVAWFKRISLSKFPAIFIYLVIIDGILIALGVLFYFKSITLIGAGRTAAISSTYPLITVVLAFILLKEKITVKHILGSILAVIGVILLS